MDVFSFCFDIVVGEEGGYTADPADPGNWTGGACGRGRCAGTRFGISASAFPHVDIAALTLTAAKAIYRPDYFNLIAGDALPPPLALLAFDAAVNNGVGRAARWLQAAGEVEQDGVLGPVTLAALHAAFARDGDALLAEYQAQRLMFMIGLPTWREFGLGWARRLCGLPFQALPLFAATCAAPPTTISKVS